MNLETEIEDTSSDYSIELYNSPVREPPPLNVMSKSEDNHLGGSRHHNTQ